MWCWQRISEATTWFFVWDAPRIAADIGGRAWPPRWSYMDNLWGADVGHAQHRDAGHAARAGDGGAGGLSGRPQHHAERALFIRPVALFIIVATRSINSLIWALLLVAIIGPGVFAGLLAIAFRSIGFCAKLLYEAIEEIDPTQVEAITATGASRWQVMAYGIVPQIMPAFAGISVFRWDINIRESTVLGLVGAGGIGLQLQASLNTLAWPQVTLILIVILAAV
jgi:phosphonate transport system permease protein